MRKSRTVLIDANIFGVWRANSDNRLMASIKTGYIAPIACGITENQSMCQCARRPDGIFEYAMITL